MDSMRKFAAFASSSARSRFRFVKREQNSDDESTGAPESERSDDSEPWELQSLRPTACGRPILRAKATAPLVICFPAPEDAAPGADVEIDGPHGPLRVRLPESAKPGETVTFWLGPPQCNRVVVPDGKAPGDAMTFRMANGEECQVHVPEDKQPGDTFDCIPPSLMVQVPEAAKPGDVVVFAMPEEEERTAVVPEGVEPRCYFAVLTLSSNHQSKKRLHRTQAFPPTQLNFLVPEDAQPGSQTVVDGPQGAMTVLVPAEAIPGENISIWVGPTTAFRVTVPEDKQPGDAMLFDFEGGRRVCVTVPDEKYPGDSFDFAPSVLMVYVPPAAQPGDFVIFTTPDEREQMERVPDGAMPHQYFQALTMSS